MSGSDRKTSRRTSPRRISTTRSTSISRARSSPRRRSAKLMMAQKSGRIINISSQAGSVALKGEAIYCMTKAAINHLTRCLAVEWAPHGITVNSVAPTFIWTDGTRPSLADPAFHAHVLGHIPLGRIGDPDRRRRDGGVPRLARRLADHRRQHPGRWRLVGCVRLNAELRELDDGFRDVCDQSRGVSSDPPTSSRVRSHHRTTGGRGVRSGQSALKQRSVCMGGTAGSASALLSFASGL